MLDLVQIALMVKAKEFHISTVVSLVSHHPTHSCHEEIQSNTYR